MPSRQQTIADAVQIFVNARYPAGLNATVARLGFYQTLLWYEPVHNDDLAFHWGLSDSWSILTPLCTTG